MAIRNEIGRRISAGTDSFGNPNRGRAYKGMLLMAMLTALAAFTGEAADGELSTAYLTGVNLAGAEFGENAVPGQHGVNYVYPVEPFAPGYRSPSYFMSRGMNTFRLPFRWERIQPVLGKPLDAAEAERLVGATEELLKIGAWVVLDMHNFAHYEGVPIGTDKVRIGDFADVWRRLAILFKTKSRVLLGLMNEPVLNRTETWVSAANAAIHAIREAGAGNLILVSGNGWSGAHSWYGGSYGKPNAEALLGIVDPLDRVAFEAHQYLDLDSSGTHNSCVSKTIGVERLQPFTRWLSEHKKLGFIGEFGAGTDAVCLSALSLMVSHIRDRSDVYLGWTYWAAGPWWPRDYFTLIEPRPGEAPQLTALLPYLRSDKPAVRRRH